MQAEQVVFQPLSLQDLATKVVVESLQKQNFEWIHTDTSDGFLRPHIVDTFFPLRDPDSGHFSCFPATRLALHELFRLLFAAGLPMLICKSALRYGVMRLLEKCKKFNSCVAWRSFAGRVCIFHYLCTLMKFSSMKSHLLRAYEEMRDEFDLPEL